MKCTAARHAIGADPQNPTPELEQHGRECQACAEFQRETRMLDERIRRALALDFDQARAPRITVVHGGRRQQERPLPARIPRVRRPWAIAASLLIAAAAGLVFWAVQPRPSIANDVVAHMKFEPWSWGQTNAISRDALAGVLGRVGMQMDPLKDDVVFAQSCWFRGKWVPHFVVRTADGPVAVMVLPDAKVRSAEPFAEGGYTGIVVPAEKGSIAVLNRNAADPRGAAVQFAQALHAQPKHS
jgi:hypothetical protein